MSKKINVRTVLKKHKLGLSENKIAQTCHMSKHSVKAVLDRLRDIEFDLGTIDNYSDDELYSMFFPTKYESENLYFKVDYDYVHNELKKPSVNLRILWDEYKDSIPEGMYPYSYPSYCRGYSDFVNINNLTNHIEHKPGETVEVDWSGDHMHYVNENGELVTVHIFVACLPYSRYAYVEPTLDEKMSTWINCNVNMLEYFHGAPKRIVCDNLKTAVVSHPKEGEIILTDQYLDFAEYYSMAIMPAAVRKPKQKASVENTVGNIETFIIARARNITFTSFNQLKLYVMERLQKYNDQPFQKRDGSRSSEFEEEKDSLQPLPNIRYEITEWTYGRKVNFNSHIQYKNNFYSVPYQYIGKSVDVKAGTETLSIFYKGKRIATHPLFLGNVKYKYSTQEQHMPEKFKRMNMEWNKERIMKWAEKIGPNTYEVINRIFLKTKIEEQAYNPTLAVLRLGGSYSNERLENACGIALRSFITPRHKHIRGILASKQDLAEKQLKNKSIDGVESHDASLDENKGHLRGSDYFKNIGQNNNKNGGKD